MRRRKRPGEDTRWFRVSFCQGGECAEIARDGDRILLRNSARPDDTVEMSREAWEAFRLWHLEPAC